MEFVTGGMRDKVRDTVWSRERVIVAAVVAVLLHSVVKDVDTVFVTVTTNVKVLLRVRGGTLVSEPVRCEEVVIVLESWLEMDSCAVLVTVRGGRDTDLVTVLSAVEEGLAVREVVSVRERISLDDKE